ncbi:chloroplast lipoate protein ligase [Amylocystis lapponica]|nr:chloroplast lipoate protein ligase [Amylocystis lapponica]
MSRLPPIFYHKFALPLPYARTLALQEQLHAFQLHHRRNSANHKDILLMLQHRPVYTAGRRQISTSPEVEAEAKRLQGIGADFVATQRGGQTTYHGPGQIVGYPLLDLGRWSPPLGIRDYICRMQKTLQLHLSEAHAIQHVPSDNTGVFLDEHTKIASIGVQVRHRLTTHGFSINVTREPLAWFQRVVACGLADVSAGCIADSVLDTGHAINTDIDIRHEMEGLAERFGRFFERDMVELDMGTKEDVVEAIRAVEEDAQQAGDWLRVPTS